MRVWHTIFIVTVLCSPSLICAQSPADTTPPTQTAAPVQSTPVPPPAQAAPVQGAPAPPSTPSGLLQPAIDTVDQTLGSINQEKWKRGNIRQEAGENIGKIIQDLKETLPPLLNDADAAPGSIAKSLPVARNVGAVYDVLLRVVEASRISAPPEQISALQDALVSLSNARLALDARMQEEATAMEKQVSDLQVTVQKQASFKCPAPPAPVAKPCVPATPHRKARKMPATPATPEKKTPPPTTTTPPKTGP